MSAELQRNSKKHNNKIKNLDRKFEESEGKKSIPGIQSKVTTESQRGFVPMIYCECGRNEELLIHGVVSLFLI